MERGKINAIYAALDVGNYKNAVKLSVRLITSYFSFSLYSIFLPSNLLSLQLTKGIENLPISKALRAIALNRMFQTEEAIALCDEVASTKPVDEVRVMIAIEQGKKKIVLTSLSHLRLISI